VNLGAWEADCEGVWSKTVVNKGTSIFFPIWTKKSRLEDAEIMCMTYACDSVFYILNWFLCYMNFRITYIMIENWLVWWCAHSFVYGCFIWIGVGLWYCIGCYGQPFGFSDSNVYTNMFLWLFDKMEGLVIIDLGFWYGFDWFCARTVEKNCNSFPSEALSPKRELQKFAIGLGVEHLAQVTRLVLSDVFSRSGENGSPKRGRDKSRLDFALNPRSGEELRVWAN